MSTISISFVGSVRTASTRTTEIFSTCPECLEYFDRLCTVSTILRPIIRHKTLMDGPTNESWSKLQLEYLEHWQYFGNTYCEECVLRVLSVSRGSVLRVLPVPQVLRVTILRVHICLSSRGSVLLILSVLSVLSVLSIVGPSQYSQYVGILSTRNILAASSLNTPSTRTTSCSRVSTVLHLENLYFTLCAKKH